MILVTTSGRGISVSMSCKFRWGRSIKDPKYTYKKRKPLNNITNQHYLFRGMFVPRVSLLWDWWLLCRYRCRFWFGCPYISMCQPVWRQPRAILRCNIMPIRLSEPWNQITLQHTNWWTDYKTRSTICCVCFRIHWKYTIGSCPLALGVFHYIVLVGPLQNPFQIPVSIPLIDEIQLIWEFKLASRISLLRPCIIQFCISQHKQFIQTFFFYIYLQTCYTG